MKGVVGGLDDVEDDLEDDVDIGAMLDEAGAVGGVAEAVTKVSNSDSEEPSNFKVNQPDGAVGGAAEANPHSWRHHQPQVSKLFLHTYLPVRAIKNEH